MVRDARYWAPLVGLYTGLRLEEIAELRADDLRRDGEIWAANVMGNEAGPVKKANSNRTVPVHPLLVRLGFTDHVGAIRARDGGALWPSRGGAGSTTSSASVRRSGSAATAGRSG